MVTEFLVYDTVVLPLDTLIDTGTVTLYVLVSSDVIVHTMFLFPVCDASQGTVRDVFLSLMIDVSPVLAIPEAYTVGNIG
jgi:hypothetical protein